MPAKAGIQSNQHDLGALDPRFRGDDDKECWSTAQHRRFDEMLNQSIGQETALTE
jgi:hypothetical protein